MYENIYNKSTLFQINTAITISFSYLFCAYYVRNTCMLPEMVICMFMIVSHGPRKIETNYL